jgi:hypothetical protein
MSENGTGPKHRLNLDDLIEPAGYFTIGDQTFAGRRWASFSALDQKRLQRDWRRLLEIDAMSVQQMEKGKVAQEYEMLGRGLLKRISDIDDDALAALDHELIGAVILDFFVSRSRWLEERAKRMAAMQTGEKSSSGSSASTTPRRRKRG